MENRIKECQMDMFADRPMKDWVKEIAALTTYSWDAVTLAGHMSFLYPGGCGDAPEQSVAVPFTLAKGAAPVEPKAAEVPA